MSEHQAIIFIISVIVITLFIWLGFGMFMDAHRASQKDDFLSAMNDIGASATGYRLRPKPLGGGGGEYLGFSIPPGLTSIDAGPIFAVVEPNRILLVGHSSRGYGTVSAIINDSGSVDEIRLEGEFQ
jgi:hypothetical protein